MNPSEQLLTGFLNINKEAGFTSFDVVAKLHGILHTKKIGHMGTLDPDATGVLPVGIGRATKAFDLIEDHSKAYDATLLLGTTTDTLDIWGRITSEKEVNITEDKLRDIIASFVGESYQTPPMYSAKKVNGKRLYDLAREGKEVERKPVLIKIDRIDIVDIRIPYIKLHIECGKGTYIRSLCDDIGKACGCGGCMTELKRTRAGVFEIRDAYTLDEIENIRDESRLSEVLLPVDRAFLQYPAYTIDSEFEKAARNGNPLYNKQIVEENIVEGPCRLYLSDGSFIGLYEMRDGRFSLRKIFL